MVTVIESEKTFGTSLGLMYPIVIVILKHMRQKVLLAENFVSSIKYNITC